VVGLLVDVGLGVCVGWFGFRVGGILVGVQVGAGGGVPVGVQVGAGGGVPVGVQVGSPGFGVSGSNGVAIGVTAAIVVGLVMI
jgi:hypothetical protein